MTVFSAHHGCAALAAPFTAVPEPVAFALVLTEAQVQMLQDFVEITLADVLPSFNIMHCGPAAVEA